MKKNHKVAARQTRRAQRRIHIAETTPPEQEITRAGKKPSSVIIKPLTDAQARYDDAIRSKKLIYGYGPAGTGKTYLATCRAADALRDGLIENIILVRPAVEAAGEKLGFLPGEMKDKYDPYLEPFYQALEERLGTGHLEYLLKRKIIDPRPMGFMRGASFKNTWLLADEMQNATKAQMKMLLTRIGENSKFIISGDPDQSDIGASSGLTDAIERTRGHKDISAVGFDVEDIVRSGLCMDIVKMYSN